MRVYNREVGGASWTSVEDYLPAGNALGYDYNWRFAYSGGELLMMSASGEPSGYYPMDSSGVMVQSEVPARLRFGKLSRYCEVCGVSSRFCSL